MRWWIFQAVILAAGKGSRLASFTKNIPKCLLEIGQKTILDRQIEILEKNGVDDIIIVAGYKINLIKEHFMKNTIKIIDNNKYDIFDGLYSILCTKDFIKDDSFICIYGDLIFNEKLISSFLKFNGVSIIVDKPTYDYDSHSVILDNDFVKNIDFDYKNQKPSAQFIGISKFPKNSIGLFKKTLDIFYENNDFNGEYVRIIKSLLKQNMIIRAFFVNNEIWININDEKKLRLAKTFFK